MGHRRRASVIPLRPVEGAAGLQAAHLSSGVLLRFPDLRTDARRDAVWDDLLSCAHQAWTWRDRDSLSELALCLLQLARDVLPEWTGPEKN